MENSLQSVRTILDYLERYEEQHPAQQFSMESFSNWLHNQFNTPVKKEDKPPSGFGGAQLEVKISIQLVLLNRFAKYYLKKVLEGSPLVTPDDWAYIASLMKHSRITKTDLIKQHGHEKTSGNEVIKRLLAKEFIAEEENPEDKRSKLVYLTDNGRKIFFEYLPKMNIVSQIISKALGTHEKNTLNDILEKLYHFHEDLFEKEDMNDFEVIAKIAQS